MSQRPVYHWHLRVLSPLPPRRDALARSNPSICDTHSALLHPCHLPRPEAATNHQGAS